ncbi:MAG: TonB-dependent receptor, partial [Opitutaceae bacterium]|nr:TonB-dependent receptor [Opitutaceae bacterium]
MRLLLLLRARILAAALLTAAALTAADGTIEGRVLNATTGVYLNQARVAVEGTRLEAFTNASGEYRLTGVPAGPATLTVRFTGLSAPAAAVTVVAGGVTTQDFSLQRAGAPTAADAATVKLDEFIVASSRDLNASDIANHEQRVAANIKNVVDADAFGDAGEGNLGEFIKFVPGVTVNYSSFDARTISVRGMPSDTTPILVDGNPVASAVSSGASRDIEVGGLMMNNIARVEVSKTPTPDSPANAMGGTVNVVNKGAFDRRKPLLTYRVSAIMNSNWLTLRELPGGQPQSTGRRVLPGVDFSYIAPFTRNFGITLNGFYTQRYSGTQMSQPIWRPNNGASNFGTATNPFLNGHTVNDQPTHWERMSFGTTLDWRVGRHGMLTLGAQFTSADMHQNIEQWATSLTGTSTTAPLAWGPTFAQSANGAGSSVLTTNARRKTDRTLHTSVKYRHTGLVWQLDAGGAVSRSTNTYRDTDFGFFSSARTQARSLNLRYDAINTVREGPGTITATTTAGAPVDLHSLASYTLVSAGGNRLSSQDAVASAHLNARRDFILRVPLQLRAGLTARRQDRDIRGETPTWNFVGPDGATLTADDNVARYDLVDPVYSRANAPFELAPFQRPSPYKLWQLYRASPQYFRLDEAGAIASNTANSRKITETISAAYLRLDTRLFRDRLGLTGGVRFERTEDDGYGRLQDIRATYRQDAEGNLIRDAAGRPIRITTDAVQLARLQYKDRGAHAQRDYADFYPSLNATWHLTPNLQARAAVARTIGRPNFNEIIPNTAITDPAAAEAARTITVVNTGLKPWSADNFDVALEYYFQRSGRVAISGFQKNIRDFFGTTRTDATPELLAEFGLNDDYLDYDVITKQNVGDARVTGFEFDYQQPLAFLPAWAGGTLAFFNVTKSHLEGASTANFSGFTRESINWGLSLNRPRWNLKLTWNQRGRQRLGAVTGAGVAPGTYTYNPEYLTLNVNAEWRIARRFAAFTVIRNIANKPLITEIYGQGTPRYARISNYQNLGSQISVGLKGE